MDCTTLLHVLSGNVQYNNCNISLFLDLLINKEDSSRVVESWVGHKTTVVCAVKVPESIQQNVVFTWMHIPSNSTVPREFHDDMRSKSYLTITTNKDKDFETLQCKAETKSTVKFHIINITKLSRYCIAQFHKNINFKKTNSLNQALFCLKLVRIKSKREWRRKARVSL